MGTPYVGTPQVGSTTHRHRPSQPQIQAELGWGHNNVIKAYEAILTPTHFALVMEFASGGSLTSYVSERFSKANTTGLFLNEDEARYFFRVCRVEYCLMVVVVGVWLYERSCACVFQVQNTPFRMQWTPFHSIPHALCSFLHSNSLKRYSIATPTMLHIEI